MAQEKLEQGEISLFSFTIVCINPCESKLKFSPQTPDANRNGKLTKIAYAVVNVWLS